MVRYGKVDTHRDFLLFYRGGKQASMIPLRAFSSTRKREVRERGERLVRGATQTSPHWRKDQPDLIRVGGCCKEDRERAAEVPQCARWNRDSRGSKPGDCGGGSR